MGKYDGLALKSSRERETRAPGSDTPIVTYGGLATPVITSRSVKNSGELGMIRKALAEAGAAKLKK